MNVECLHCGHTKIPLIFRFDGSNSLMVGDEDMKLVRR
jgi:hypothetical protein